MSYLGNTLLHTLSAAHFHTWMLHSIVTLYPVKICWLYLVFINDTLLHSCIFCISKVYIVDHRAALVYRTRYCTSLAVVEAEEEHSFFIKLTQILSHKVTHLSSDCPVGYHHSLSSLALSSSCSIFLSVLPQPPVPVCHCHFNCNMDYLNVQLNCGAEFCSHRGYK